MGWPAVGAFSPNNAFRALGYDLYGLGDMLERATQTAGGGFNQTHAVEALFGYLNLQENTPVDLCWVSVGLWSLLGLGLTWYSLGRQEVVGDAGTR